MGLSTKPWAVEPAKITLEDLHELLLWAASEGCSDIILLADEPPVVRLSRCYHRVAQRRFSTPELQEVLNDLHGANASALLMGAEDLNFSYQVRRSRTEFVRFRGNATAGQTALSPSGLEIVFRTLSALPPTLSELGIEQDIVDAHRELADGQGLCFLVGSTGTGKTTLLAAMMRDILERSGKKVLTYEAPIEFLLSGLPNQKGIAIQTEIPRHLPEFHIGVANALRRAPDVIMVGESRDLATIRGAIQAGQTGHAVYATLHAHSVAAALPRAVGDFPPDEQLSLLARALDVLRLVITQRLVPGVNGGLVALREYLVFDRSMRSQLLQVGLNQLQAAIYSFVRERGRTLLQDAELKRDLLAPGVIEALRAELAETHGASA